MGLIVFSTGNRMGTTRCWESKASSIISGSAEIRNLFFRHKWNLILILYILDSTKPSIYEVHTYMVIDGISIRIKIQHALRINQSHHMTYWHSEFLIHKNYSYNWLPIRVFHTKELLLQWQSTWSSKRWNLKRRIWIKPNSAQDYNWSTFTQVLWYNKLHISRSLLRNLFWTNCIHLTGLFDLYTSLDVEKDSLKPWAAINGMNLARPDHLLRQQWGDGFGRGGPLMMDEISTGVKTTRMLEQP